MGRIRYETSANQEMVGSGMEFGAAAQDEVDTVETSGRGVEGTLEGGAGADQVGAVQKILRAQGEEQIAHTHHQVQNDRQVGDVNESGMAKFTPMFGNNA